MSPENEEIKRVIEDAVKSAVKDSVHSELGTYKIPKEEHYIDHMWLRGLREWQTKLKNAAWKTLVGMVISFLVGLMILGFFAAGGKH